MVDLLYFGTEYFNISCQETCTGSILHRLKHLETHSAVAPGLQLCPKKPEDIRKEKSSDILASGFRQNWHVGGIVNQVHCFVCRNL